MLQPHGRPRQVPSSAPPRQTRADSRSNYSRSALATTPSGTSNVSNSQPGRPSRRSPSTARAQHHVPGAEQVVALHPLEAGVPASEEVLHGDVRDVQAYAAVISVPTAPANTKPCVCTTEPMATPESPRLKSGVARTRFRGC